MVEWRKWYEPCIIFYDIFVELVIQGCSVEYGFHVVFIGSRGMVFVNEFH